MQNGGPSSRKKGGILVWTVTQFMGAGFCPHRGWTGDTQICIPNPACLLPAFCLSGGKREELTSTTELASLSCYAVMFCKSLFLPSWVLQIQNLPAHNFFESHDMYLGCVSPTLQRMWALYFTTVTSEYLFKLSWYVRRKKKSNHIKPKPTCAVPF